MILIGTIVKPQGIKGEVKVVPVADAKRCSKISHAFVDDKELLIKEIISRGGDLYISFDGIDDRNKAELLRGKDVFAKKEELEKLQENEFYFEDLIGAKVEDEKGIRIGEIIEIEQYGSADVISIRENNIVFAVPFLDSIFKSVLPEKVIVSREEYDNNKICD